MKIVVVGLGYVGLSIATLLSTKFEVVGLERNEKIIDSLNKNIPHLKDGDIEAYFSSENLNFQATNNAYNAYKNADYVVISTPTDYNEITDAFDTTSIETVMDDVMKFNPGVNVVIKSTIPVGYTEKMKDNYGKHNIFFSPEFLREGKALHDNLYPSRIIVGSKENFAVKFADMLKDASLIPDKVQVLYMENTEAESVKLFANTYLALRISFFNEVDTFCELNGLNSKDIIQGMSLDPRIGNYYNNPSFGYGGYCLPKDTKQLNASFGQIDNVTIRASIDANELRKEHVFNQVVSKNPNVIGIYRLTMKSNSDNFRSSSIFSLIDKLILTGRKVVIFEPMYQESQYEGIEIYKDLDSFAEIADIIVANRVDEKINKYADKIYTRDVFNEN